MDNSVVELTDRPYVILIRKINEYMIKTTTRTIHFVAYSPRKGKEKDTSAPPYANVNVKFGRMVIPKKSINSLAIDGKFVRLFFDSSKSIIGWQVKESGTLEELKSWKLVKINTAGNYTVSIRGILDEFQGLSKESYNKLEIKKYTPLNTLERGQEYFYIKVAEGEEIGEEE